ncbi:MAG: N-6 DNA methylase [Harvfovirus sp.]|uniref:N-6 DNA methylase n=1 Tax=Harvfovirus sp. TaxID=2487768 RepID=A0A3G5A2X7_9VIRU|nr:MAG: N-6 DNA methylase [Harvfovirus sp.]
MEIKRLILSLEKILVENEKRLSVQKKFDYCMLFTIYRFLTNEICEKLEMSKSFSFRGGREEVEKIREIMYCECTVGEPKCITESINKIFGMKIEYDLRNVETLEEIIRILREFEINETVRKGDIFGSIYEIFKGRTSGTLSNNSYQYIERSIIDYMINLCEMEHERENIISIPFVHNIGMMTRINRYMKSMNRENEGMNKLWGYGNTKGERNMELMSMYIESGSTDLKDIEIRTGDIMKGLIRPNEKNPTTIISNINKNEICFQKSEVTEEIRSIMVNGHKINQTNSNLGLLLLFVKSLTANGELAIIVPDKILSEDALPGIKNNQYVMTRKYMLTQMNVKRIISLKNMIKDCSIIYARKGSPTEVIEFSYLMKEGDKVREDQRFKITMDKMKENNYIMDIETYMNEMDEGNESEKDDGKGRIILGDILAIEGKGKTDETKLKTDKKKIIRYYSSEHEEEKYSSSHDFFHKDKYYLLLAISGGSIGRINLVSGKTAADGSIISLTFKSVEKIMPEYVEYMIKNRREEIIKLRNEDSSKIDIEKILKLEMRVASIEDQGKFIYNNNLISNHTEIIEAFCDKENNKENMVNYIMTLTNGAKTKKLSELTKVTKAGQTDNSKGELYPYYTPSGVEKYVDTSILEGEIILIARISSSKSEIYYTKGKVNYNSDMIALEFNEILKAKYVYYYMRNCKPLKYSTAKSITQKRISLMEIPVIKAELQERIIEYCDILSLSEKGSILLEHNRFCKEAIYKNHISKQR